jgi:hypothetical protein
MQRRTRHLLVHASIIALTLLEVVSIQQGEVVRNPGGELNASVDVGVGPLLVNPRVTTPPTSKISTPVVSVPGLVALHEVGHLPTVLADLSLQKEHVRIQI